MQRYVMRMRRFVSESQAADLLDALQVPIRTPKLVKRESIPTLETNYAKYFSMRPKTAMNYHHLLRAQGKQRKLDDALMTYEKYLEEGNQPDVFILTTMIDIFGQRKELDRAFHMLEVMKEAKITPTHYTYAALVHACSYEGHIDQALEVMTLLKSYGKKPDQVIYTSLIKTAFKSNKIGLAWDIFYDMTRDKDVEPDEVTYSYMIHLSAQKGETERALRLFDDMTASNLNPTEVTYNSLIHACAKRLDYYEEAYRIFGMMKAAGYLPDYGTYISLMKVAAENGDIESCETLVVKLYDQHESKHIQVDEKAWNLLLHAYSRAQIGSKVEDRKVYTNRSFAIVEDMSQLFSKPSMITCNSLLGVVCMGDSHKDVERAIKLLESYGYALDGYSYGHLLKYYGHHRQVDQLDVLWEEMKAKGIPYQRIHYDMMIYGLARGHKVERAVEILKEMRQRAYDMKPRTKKIMKTRLLSNHHPNKYALLRTYQEMIENKSSQIDLQEAIQVLRKR